MELLYWYNENQTIAVCCGIDDMNYDGEVVIPSLAKNGAIVLSIASSAFSKSKVATVHIPRTITSIGQSAFSFCDNLSAVTFEENSALETIEPMAFIGCNNLKNIRLPDKVRVIEQMAFDHCRCEIPRGCLIMFPNFEGCKVIEYSPEIPEPAPIEKDELGNEYYLDESRDGYVIKKIYARNDVITVPETFNGLPVVQLGDMVFTWNREAWKTIIPASVKKAGYFPFYGCEEMGLAEYRGTTADWKKMGIYTWFSVKCSDGII